MSLYKALRICLISATIICVLPLKTSLGCGGGDYWFEDTHYSFYNDESFFPANPYKSLNFSEWIFNDDQRDNRVELNTMDWQRYFGKNWSLDSIAMLVYKSTLNELSAKNDSGSKPQVLNLVKRIPKRKNEVLTYLKYAKTCEPQVDYTSVSDGWYETQENRNHTTMDSLITIGLKEMAETKSTFLKERYAYQVVRLAHYLHDYERCVHLFDSLWNKPSHTLMYYWSLSHKAGACISLGKKSEASYYFSKVIESNTGRTVQAHRGFTIESQEDWDAAYALCRSNQEKANMWFVQSIGLNDRSLPGMRQISKLTGEEDMLLHLFGRDIMRMEEVLNLSGNGYFDFDYSAAYYQDLYAFVDSLSKHKKKLKYGGQWEFGKAYLMFLQNNYPKAREHFKHMTNLLKKDSSEAAVNLIEQSKMVEMLMKYRYVEWNTKLENEVVADLNVLNDNNHREAYSFLLEIVINARLSHHGETMDVLMQNDFYGFLDHPSNYNLNELIAKYTRKDKAPFEQFFVNRFYYQLGDLYYFKATDFMLQNQLDSARAFYKLAHNHPRKGYYRTRTMANIEENKIKSCNDCDYEEFDGQPQEMGQIIDRMKALKYSINAPYANPDTVAKKAMILGNMYYNLSGSGNCWYMLRFSFSGADVSIKNSENEDTGEDVNGLAYRHYKLAFDQTSDPELQAHLLFLMAMCEQANYYTDSGYEYNWYSKEEEDVEYQDEHYRVHFSKLIKNYRETNFFASALNECGYLNKYYHRNSN